MLNSIQKLWKNYSCLLVYTALALLAISDTGYFFFMIDYVGTHVFLLKHLCAALLSIKIIGTRYTKKEFFLLSAVMIPAIFNYSICRDDTLIYSILVIAALKEVDLSTVFKTLFFATFSAILFFGILSCLGIAGGVALTEDFGRGSIETRYYWGLRHPNTWHMSFARAIVYFVLAFRKCQKWHTCLLLLLLNYIAYRFTASRTGFLATSAFLLMVIACQYWGKIIYSAFMRVTLITGIAAGYGFFVYCMNALLSHPNEILNFINRKLFTGRISLAGSYLANHPIQFWGSHLYSDVVFDCGFLRLFYRSGYLLAGIFFLAFFLLLYQAMKYKKGTVVSTCVFIALYSFYEIDPVTRPTFNIVIFFMAALVYGMDYLKGSVD